MKRYCLIFGRYTHTIKKDEFAYILWETRAEYWYEIYNSWVGILKNGRKAKEPFIPPYVFETIEHISFDTLDFGEIKLEIVKLKIEYGLF